MSKSVTDNITDKVFVIDDDESIRESLKSLMRSVGLRVETFASAQEFLQSTRPDVPACLILDVRMPGLSGLDLQRELAQVTFTFRSSSSPGTVIFRCPCVR